MIAFCSILVDKFFIIRQAFSITSKLNLITIGGVVLFVRLLNIFSYLSFVIPFYHGPDVSRAMVLARPKAGHRRRQ